MVTTQQLDLDQAQAGMVLGEHALGRYGQLLLRAGTVLNDRHLQMLHANAVARVSVGAAADSARSPGRWAVTARNRSPRAFAFAMSSIR